MQRLVGTGTYSYSPQMYKVVSLLLVLLSFLYFGWINKNQSVQNQNEVDGDISGEKIYSRFNLVASEPFSFLPSVKADTLKEDKILEQEVKIKEQEAMIRDLEAKIKAMEAREKSNKEKQNDWKEGPWRQESVEQHLRKVREQLDLTLELKERVKSQLEEVDFGWVKDMEMMFNDTLIVSKDTLFKKFPGFNYFEHMDDRIVIKSEIEERLKAINEQIVENMSEFRISEFDDFAMDMESLKETLELKKLDMVDIRIEMNEAMDAVKEELQIFEENMGHFKKKLLQSLIEDGIINDDFEDVKITQKNGTIIINGEKLSEKLSKKYRTLIEEELGKKYLDNNNFSFEFDGDWE